MKFTVRLFDIDTVDCTADPHFVTFKAQEELAQAVLRVCQSKLVATVHSVRLTVGEKPALSFSIFRQDAAIIESLKETIPEAELEALSQALETARDFDAKEAALRKVGPILVERAVRKIRAHLRRRSSEKIALYISVTWAFAEDSACSDFIEIEDLSSLAVNFSNTDWYTHNENYLGHLKDLSQLIGCDFIGAIYVKEAQSTAAFVSQEALFNSVVKVCASKLVKGIGCSPYD